MIGHIILSVSDIERSLKFYEAALKPLNISMFMPFKGVDGHDDLWGFGDGTRAIFWLKQGTPNPDAIHWGFDADNNEVVDAFYAAAIAAGAIDRISPRARLEYYPGYYSADVIDPDGYHFEVTHLN
ncbi:VOC family protein [Pseudomonas sp. SZMC_28357]|uniref:VOC family protein n=1 Tax=Pseudomonas sp. SZMC_28357 TaxID=3074380 RepID=UPI0028714243|nr:VOC family protein [Pseudomonas sp. SZMC_28357]MDR9753788.1 VOC family protein [Pseudomonas sp. SZMC_28357]